MNTTSSKSVKITEKNSYFTGFEYWPTAFLPKGTSEYCLNVYVDLHGRLRSRLNPTIGLYIFDGQVFYKKKAAQ